MSRSWLVLLSSLALLYCCSATTVEYDSNAIILDGERKIIFAGAIHYPRSTPEMWPDLFRKAKEGGIDAVETYVFWDRHEPRRRVYDFSGNLDFVKFFKLAQEAGLYVILRIGPYVCAEWTYGGFPMWLHSIPGIELRTDNEIYKNEMQIFTTKIVNICKENKLFAPQGGPIILAQIENEYGNIMGGYGDAGKSYIKWSAQMATAQNIGVPWIMCQQSDAPAPMINTCNGFYCDFNFHPNNPKNPKMFTENWTGWFKLWGGKDPYRTAEDLAYSVARFVQSGGVLNNYYMYHGGTNFGRTAGGPYITTSYDYNAPLDEYGNLNQPKWGHLKQLHEAIKVGEKILTNGTTKSEQKANDVYLTTYTNSSGAKFCFLSNTDKSNDANIDLGQDGKFTVPAWSVSILKDCNKEIYSTAKVNSQTSLMIKTLPEHDKPAALSWSWAPEAMKDTLQGTGRFRANQLLDQKEATSDASDYLWYMTSSTYLYDNSPYESTSLYFHFDEISGSQFSRQANGQQSVKGDDYSFIFEKPISLKSGANVISLLSATVGLTNYGQHFDLKAVGIANGSVQIVQNGNVLMDLSSNQWSYKVGLNGEAKHLHDPNSIHNNVWSASQKVPAGRPMTWYKTTFTAPSGTDPVVVDLLGMGKGHAWVNGNSLGRFWPSQVSSQDGCGSCDYRGKYNGGKCPTNCGNPSQRWYHVPRSFLNKNGPNTLIMFEEVGGNPSNVTFQTVTVGTVCGNAYEGSTLELSCQGGRTISDIQFVSFGDPQGTCGSFQRGSFEATHSLAPVEKACVGRGSCLIMVSDVTFGVKNIGNEHRLAVQAVCE
ncbi:hypothetical protein HS088_TW04G00357 [Tripterygium wilfordii]|uniref:Beta-galactosidase n=1 Tax=Tripterygium wilfordii TaxID=458696 RepID=A0A7J7DQF4_TRIWF|nr:hypothetical protein HS088_TW04G00357 [Tripterygium wilfordii]